MDLLSPDTRLIRESGRHRERSCQGYSLGTSEGKGILVHGTRLLLLYLRNFGRLLQPVAMTTSHFHAYDVTRSAKALTRFSSRHSRRACFRPSQQVCRMEPHLRGTPLRKGSFSLLHGVARKIMLYAKASLMVLPKSHAWCSAGEHTVVNARSLGSCSSECLQRSHHKTWLVENYTSAEAV